MTAIASSLQLKVLKLLVLVYNDKYKCVLCRVGQWAASDQNDLKRRDENEETDNG